MVKLMGSADGSPLPANTRYQEDNDAIERQGLKVTGNPLTDKPRDLKWQERTAVLISTTNKNESGIFQTQALGWDPSSVGLFLNVPHSSSQGELRLSAASIVEVTLGTGTRPQV